MNTKKIIAIISLIVLIGGVVVFALWIKNKPTKEQKAFANKFAQDMQEAKNDSTTGTVESIDSQKMVVRLGKEHATVRMSGDVIVTILSGSAKKTIAGKMTDIKVGDNIKVVYDKVTMMAVSITLAKD
jgi:preprotein translocase subunit YajC